MNKFTGFEYKSATGKTEVVIVQDDEFTIVASGESVDIYRADIPKLIAALEEAYYYNGVPS